MALNALSNWKSSYKNIPQSETKEDGVKNVSDWLEKQASLLVLDTSTVSSSSYTWGKDLFKSYLETLSPTESKLAVQELANAWEVSVIASLMVVQLGAYSGSATLATTWIAPPVVAILPTSVVAAKAVMVASLLQLEPVSSFDDVQIPEILRTAFLSLQFSVAGLNSVPPPTGPQPLSILSAGVA